MSVKICAVWTTQRQEIAFLNYVKQKSNFSQTMTTNSEMKNKQILPIKLLYETTQEIVQKICKLDSGKWHA